MKNGAGYFEKQLRKNLAAPRKNFGVCGGPPPHPFGRGGCHTGCDYGTTTRRHLHRRLQNNAGEKDSWGYYCMVWVPRGVGGPSSPRSAIKAVSTPCLY